MTEEIKNEKIEACPKCKSDFTEWRDTPPNSICIDGKHKECDECGHQWGNV